MTNRKKIFFRADGNSEIGLGHVIRSLALAEMLKEDFDCIFATRFLTDYIRTEVRKVCGDIIKLPESDDHFEAFLSILSGEEIVVLDNYFFTTEYQQKIKDIDCKLVCIDDMHNKHFVADIIINHAPQVKPSDYSVEKHTTLCLGFKYLLLRSIFFSSLLNRKIQKKVNTFFVCFGGSDYNNLTQQTIEVLLSGHYIIYAVIGDANRNNDDLSSKFGKHPNIFILYGLSAIEMFDIMQKSDMAIVPASSVLLEVIAVKMPVITGYYADNQKEGCLYCVNQGLALYVDMINEYKTHLEKILSTVNNLVCDKLIQMQEGLIQNPKPLYLDVFQKLI